MKRRIVLSIALVAAVAGAVFMAAPSVFADRYTRAQLDTRLENGINTAINWDSNMSDPNSCRSVTDLARRNGASIATLRNNYINTSFAGRSTASYRSSTWLSRLSFPNTTNPVTVTYGATTIDLQINNVSFLCGTLVMPDVGTSCSGLSTASMFDDARWVYTTNPDQSPNPLGNTCLRPARTGTTTRIEGVQVTSTGSFGGTTNITPGRILATTRDNLSRYWFSAPIGFRYTFNAPVTTSGTIRLTLRVKRIQSYNTGDDRCQSRGNSITVASPTDFARCDISTDTVALQIQPLASYNLHPDAVPSVSSVGNGESFTVDGGVRNNGGTASTSSNWRMTRMYFAAGVTPPATAPAAGSAAACAAYTGYVAGSCQTIAQGTRGFPLGTTAVGTNTPETADLARGAQVCYTGSVNTPTPAAAPAWRHSALRCVVIGKKPKTQVWGGDVRVRGLVNTSTSQVTGRNFGSWGEYGVFATGSIAGMASGSGLNTGSTDPAVMWNKLTFANIDNSGGPSFGSFALPVAKDLGAQFGAGGGAPSPNLGSLASGNYETNTTGTVTINTSDIGQQAGRGKKIVVRVPNGTVRITGNITYRGPGAGDTFTNIDQLPQVIIIANRIDIMNSVGRVDAWLLTVDTNASPTIANDYINTCGDVAPTGAIALSQCTNVLAVNGPVMTSHLYLRRTAGSGSTAATAGDPAEVFNLRADTFLWARNQAAQNGKAQTVYSVELPPRF
jgi:hypothetical protein